MGSSMASLVDCFGVAKIIFKANSNKMMPPEIWNDVRDISMASSSI